MATYRAPIIPRATDIAWRFAPMADDRRINSLLRLFGARTFPVGVNHGRLAIMGLPDEITRAALRRVGSVQDWDVSWTWAAQRFLGEARVYQRTGQHFPAAVSQRHAALAYHVAGVFVLDDPRKPRALRASSSSLFQKSLPVLQPTVRRVQVPWRTSHLPGYLIQPLQATSSVPLAVMLNGTSTSKEETLLWSDPFLKHGLAFLALDWPGSGESALTVAPTADCDDVSEGFFSISTAQPGIDASRIGLVGFS